MPLTSFWAALGGLGIFLLGMNSLSEGLQKLAGGKVRQFLEKVTGNRLAGAFAGSCLASLLQSSSAAAILVVGFINAGLISLYQALGVLLGTGIGATLAVQFIAFRISSIAFPAVFFGVVLRCFVRSRRLANVGHLLLGTGLVFLGLQLMEAGFIPLKTSTLFQGLHSQFFHWRISAVLLGALITFLVQSSSAAAGIVIAVTGGGLLSFENGVAMIMGEVLGTSLITGIASINGTLTAKRTAFIYFVMNAAALVLVLLFFPYFLGLVVFLTPGSVPPGTSTFGTALLTSSNYPGFSRGLANSHTVFSLVCALFYLPLTGFFARSAANIFPGRKGDIDYEARTAYIDLQVLDTPSIALLQAKRELQRMAEIARSMFDDIVEQLYSFDVKRSHRIGRKEQALDVLQRDLSAFLVLLSRRPAKGTNIMELPILLHMVNSLEHMGDQSYAISVFLQRKKEKDLYFSDAAMAEMKSLAETVSGCVHLCAESIGTTNEGDVEKGRGLKAELEQHLQKISRSHIERLTSGRCDVSAGVVFNDIVAALSKIGDYAVTIVITERELVP